MSQQGHQQRAARALFAPSKGPGPEPGEDPKLLRDTEGERERERDRSHFGSSRLPGSPWGSAQHRPFGSGGLPSGPGGGRVLGRGRLEAIRPKPFGCSGPTAGSRPVQPSSST